MGWKSAAVFTFAAFEIRACNNRVVNLPQKFPRSEEIMDCHTKIPSNDILRFFKEE
jgi:hypothetical protein